MSEKTDRLISDYYFALVKLTQARETHIGNIPFPHYLEKSLDDAADALRAEIARMEKVIEAAQKWYHTKGLMKVELYDAVRAYEAEE